MNITSVLFDYQMGRSWSIPKSPTPYHIILLVIKGKITYTIGDTVISLQRGDGLFIQAGTLRSALTDPTEPHQMFSVHFNDALECEMPMLGREAYRTIRTISFDYLKQRFSLLYDCWIGQMPCYEIITKGIMVEILGILQRELMSKQHPSSKQSLAMHIQQYIVTHYRHPFRLKDLAQHVDRTPNYISSVFKEVTGRTPVEYLHQVRITAAREMLLNTDMTIKEISDYLGYCDQTYFNHIYKKNIGYPPTFTAKRGIKPTEDEQ
ncbi:AraC family transcriptional regulator [Paenibacillus agricola]|uniref:Helix-turn-helix transcriptional regulator n=1 Tax=Paenibacillus agricola TaxID=2716264 RepID=A0ABX0JE61_9BACL|nr:AraC family transcriptional regulator [Paenibacillus agricola]NHN34208.1 helix-turn-helix transcriptional regulator [Paenibacillus agricola]